MVINQEGKYITYNKNGIINTISTYSEGKLNGIVQAFNSDGKNLRESYYIDGKQVIYSEFYAANNGEYEKQVFNSVIDGVAYPIGQLVKSNNVVQSDMSFYATITCDDTLTTPPFALIIDVFVPYEDAIFEVSFGKPDKNLNLISIDTSFVSASNRMEFIDKELESGMNNIFCEVNVISKDTVTFYAYKEVFIKD
ncbi:MAG: hypothetical protein U9N72_07735 [Bacteroidota bacterium]|nr:hypothetical protein [Bacteroidota bacterium]